MSAKSSAEAVPDVLSLLDSNNLHAVFQPIVDVAECALFGHEGLIRGPSGSDLHMPAALFAEANAAGIADEFEFVAADVIMTRHAAAQAGTLLFVDFSARAITRLGTDEHRGDFSDSLLRCGLPARSLVIEIIEHERVYDHSGLANAVRFLRGLGAAIALDDFGDGSSSLRLWAELQPEYVKIDRYFCHGIHSDGRKVQTVKAMLRLAESLGSRMIAQGIEDTHDLRVVRDLGIAFAQGHALGQADADLGKVVPDAALTVLAARDIAVFPEMRRVFNYSPRADQLLIPAPPIIAATTNQEVLQLFKSLPHLHAIAVVEEGRPVGLLNRRRFSDKYLLPYYPEIYGRRSCTEFMDRAPVLIEASQPLEELVHILTSADQRYLNDGYVLVDAGLYIGLGTAEALVRSVTELRIEAARHANPLTFLPGNIPISEHIRRLLAGGVRFAASYCDLNNFKPFNDVFGYWHGDKMIRLLASVIVAECDTRRDFAGHVGGDDFVVLFQSSNWEERCARIIENFNLAALTLFDDDTRARGYIEAEDRLGAPARFALTTLSIGGLTVEPGMFHAAEDVASAAAAAKHRAKKLTTGLYIRHGD